MAMAYSLLSRCEKGVTPLAAVFESKVEYAGTNEILKITSETVTLLI
jgi:hypothetical protein